MATYCALSFGSLPGRIATTLRAGNSMGVAFTMAFSCIFAPAAPSVSSPSGLGKILSIADAAMKRRISFVPLSMNCVCCVLMKLSMAGNTCAGRTSTTASAPMGKNPSPPTALLMAGPLSGTFSTMILPATCAGVSCRESPIVPPYTTSTSVLLTVALPIGNQSLPYASEAPPTISDDIGSMERFLSGKVWK